jgi:hypothetical protein
MKFGETLDDGVAYSYGMAGHYQVGKDVEGAVKVRVGRLPVVCGCPCVWQTVHRPDMGSSVSDRPAALLLGSLFVVALRFIEKSAVLLRLLFELPM